MTTRLSPASIDRVKQAADIVQVIGGYVQLRKAGRQYAGLCPFHEEKSPSFYVTPRDADDKGCGFWKCFGCGKGGDVLKFLLMVQGGTFPEAVEDLAQRYGM